MIYIDKRFKKEMEEFERVKLLSEDIIKVNSKRMNITKIWKSNIRKTLINVRQNFIDWID